MDIRDLITNPERLGGVPEVARLCDCTEQAVYRWVRISRIPKHRLNFLRLAKPEAFQEAQPPAPEQRQ